VNRSPRPLYELLLAIFRSNNELDILLTNYKYSNAGKLVAALPATTVPRTVFTLEAVKQIQAHALDNDQFFKILTDEFPGRSNLIEKTRKDYFGEAPAPVEQPTEVPKVADLGPPPSVLKASFEKVLGDRPTFLDVAYLAIGAQRAKSVAKLRMKIAGKWHLGTGFLVTPDTMLTAHHNLWGDGERASEVEVIFDYERSEGGAELEATVVVPDPETITGDAAADWAMFKLPAPQAGRPTAPLSDRPAAENDRVAIIQHPGGMLKQVALHHNLVSYADDSLVQYLTDTMPGSSGSPVFDSRWKVVAIHSSNVEIFLPEKKEAVFRNQGVPIQLVLAGNPAFAESLGFQQRNQ
jgi:hypothetical protein